MQIFKLDRFFHLYGIHWVFMKRLHKTLQHAIYSINIIKKREQIPGNVYTPTLYVKIKTRKYFVHEITTYITQILDQVDEKGRIFFNFAHGKFDDLTAQVRTSLAKPIKKSEIALK